MRVVLTVLVRDEADVIDAQVAYHLNAGVDFVIATDHESQDGTTEILEAYERDGVLRLIREQGPVQESAWRTRMARLAAVEHGADWVINTDADEFWMPRGESLSGVLAAVSRDYGVVHALSRHFVPRPGLEGLFSERMTARVAYPAAVNDPVSPYRPSSKAAHRGDPAVTVVHGAHGAHVSLPQLRGWFPADVLHFPYRSLEQYERKNARRAHGVHSLGQYVRGVEADRRGKLADAYRALVIDDNALAQGVANGSLVIDTRLRDALRYAGEPERHGSVAPLATMANGVLVGDAAALADANVVRLQRTVDDLGARLAVLESRA
jgi:hypothetical protein